MSDYVAGCTLLEIQRTAQIRFNLVVLSLHLSALMWPLTYYITTVTAQIRSDLVVLSLHLSCHQLTYITPVNITLVREVLELSEEDKLQAAMDFLILILILSYLIRELLELSEEDKLQAAMDVAEAVYFIHNLSNPVVHQVMTELHRTDGG